MNELEGAMMFGSGGLDAFYGDGRDFLADSVAGDDGDAGVGTAVAERDVGHAAWLRVGCEGVTLAHVAEGYQ